MACIVTVSGGRLPQAEIEAYVLRAIEKYDKEPIAMEITVDGAYVNLTYEFSGQLFHRIRRITGYLVGTLDRFNDAKRAEERDRARHSAQ